MTAQREEWRAGWRNVLAASIGLGLGTASYGPVASLFLTALEKEFGWSKTVAAGAMIALPATALFLPTAGRLIDRFGVRVLSAISVLCSVVCFIWLSRINGRVGEYYAVLIALYVLGCATGPIAYTRLIAAQFKTARGSALAVSQFGIALIAIAMPPIVGAVISGYGWRSAYLLFAGTNLLGGLVAQLCMRPDAIAAVPDRAGDQTNLKAVLTSGGFWLLGGAILLISIASYGLVFQFQAVLISLGKDGHTAMLYLSVLALSAALSRLFVGRLLDLDRPERWAALLIFLAALGPALLLWPTPGSALITLGVLLIGLSIGAELDLMSFFCARLFGIQRYSVVYGMLSIFFYFGTAMGAIGFGAIYDVTGTFRPALAAMAGLLILSALLFLSIERLGKRPSRR